MNEYQLGRPLILSVHPEHSDSRPLAKRGKGRIALHKSGIAAALAQRLEETIFMTFNDIDEIMTKIDWHGTEKLTAYMDGI